MNIKRFTAKTSREALALVRQALGEDAVVLSTRPAGDGVEVLALAPEGMARIEQAANQSVRASAPVLIQATTPMPSRTASLAERIAARGERLPPQAEPGPGPGLMQRLAARHEPRIEPSLGSAEPAMLFAANRSAQPLDTAADHGVAQDAQTLGMSTLTFQDYVRERMLKRRQAELGQTATPSVSAALQAGLAPRAAAPVQASAARPPSPRRPVPDLRLADLGPDPELSQAPAMSSTSPPSRAMAQVSPLRRDPPVLRDKINFSGAGAPDLLDDGAPNPSASSRERSDLMGELRSVRDLIEERFGMLAFMERLQRDPRQANLSQKLFDTGLSPALVRKLVQSLPADLQQAPDPLAWAAAVLERNVLTDEHEAPLEDHDGVLALVGPTGVGKTTSTAKLAAAFATRHGAAQLGLITLDAYRVAAHEQLRTYGRILGVPVHTAHDRASLEDLLELLSAKKLVLIDTAGMAQRDSRTRELLDMLQHPAIKKLLVVNAAAQGETVEDVMLGYGVQQCHGVIVSKLDEAVKLGPALDALIRHKCKVVGVANGQRVPEDWHRLSAQALVQRALRGGGGASWRLDAAEVNLMFAATQGGGYPGPQGLPAGGGQTAPLHA